MLLRKPTGLGVLIVAFILVFTGCGDEGNGSRAHPGAGDAAETQETQGGLSQNAGERHVPDGGALVVFLGDSITAGYGLSQEQAFPALVARELERRGRPARVVNAGVSGDTTAGGLRRIDWILGQKPDVVVVELGANDGLRGLELDESEKNLREIIRRIDEAGAEVLVVGMMLPPNYGPDYTRGFKAIYPELADELDVALMPFGLEDVAAVPSMNLPDGIHPNAEGHQRIAANLLPYLEPLLP